MSMFKHAIIHSRADQESRRLFQKKPRKLLRPFYHAVRSEQLADRVLQERRKQEIRQANINEVTGSTPKSLDKEVQVSIEENKSVSVSPVSSCLEVNSIRVCQINKVPVSTQHNVFRRSIDS